MQANLNNNRNGEMKVSDFDTGKRIYDLCDRIFPICRSITGEGIRQTLRIIDDHIQDTGYSLNVVDVPTGTRVFDWTIPEEWNIYDAYIENSRGNKIVSFKDCNLHVMGYSTPVDTWMDLEDMNKHIFTEPNLPEYIPYVTSYYKKDFGFCMSENQRKQLKPGKYHLYIDSQLKEGNLTYADLRIEGHSKEEVMITTYICHPSMADDICSGIALLSELIRYISMKADRKYTYRFVFEPETIGAIAYISKNLTQLKENVKVAVNLSCVGDNRAFTLIESPYANTYTDRLFRSVLLEYDKVGIYPYTERGSDERQYASAGVGLPMVCFCRSKFGEFPEYHTSADNMSLVSPQGFQGSYDVLTKVIDTIEKNGRYKATVLAEPQMGKRGLYPMISRKGVYDDSLVFCDILSYANGNNDLLTIAEMLHRPVFSLLPYVDILKDKGLLSEAGI